MQKVLNKINSKVDKDLRTVCYKMKHKKTHHIDVIKPKKLYLVDILKYTIIKFCSCNIFSGNFAGKHLFRGLELLALDLVYHHSQLKNKEIRHTHVLLASSL